MTWKVVEHTITAVVTCNDRNQCFSDDIWPLVNGISRSFLPWFPVEAQNHGIMIILEVPGIFNEHSIFLIYNLIS